MRGTSSRHFFRALGILQGRDLGMSVLTNSSSDLQWCPDARPQRSGVGKLRGGYRFKVTLVLKSKHLANSCSASRACESSCGVDVHSEG